jgi:hypothetical protein
MFKYSFFSLVLFFSVINVSAQDTLAKKQRLDFAKMYLETGGSYMPSFTGKRLLNNQVQSIDHSASLNQYITWGAFHFWGHTEFYVTIPIKHNSLTTNPDTDFQLFHSVATGARLYPWAVQEKKISPYVGLQWGALDFKQIIKTDDVQPNLSKDIMLNYEAGFTLNYKKIGARIGINYFPNNTWDYPISKTIKENIKTPPYALQFGLLYAMETTKGKNKSENDKLNGYPKVSKLSFNATSLGDFFVGIGPSSSFSLKTSEYNKTRFPYLKQKLVSNAYFDYTIGYQFNKANLYTALSFRNPTFETKGFDAKQTIKKNSLALEINKYLTDYTGFAPYIGVNVAYDNIKYKEEISGNKREFSFENKLEPGITFGWDIVPGKTAMPIVLRTNLRWYPKANFSVDGHKFDFSQLEYNLIQVVFYPGRVGKIGKFN